MIKRIERRARSDHPAIEDDCIADGIADREPRESFASRIVLEVAALAEIDLDSPHGDGFADTKLDIDHVARHLVQALEQDATGTHHPDFLGDCSENGSRHVVHGRCGGILLGGILLGGGRTGQQRQEQEETDHSSDPDTNFMRS